KGVLIMSDEIYEKLVYDGAEHVSVASFSPAHYEHTILVHGFAKAYSMTGWRLGYLAAPEPIAKAIDAIQSHSTSNPTSFAQKGAVAALNGPQDHLKIWLAEYARRRGYAHKRLNSIPGISCVNAKGAFYLFPNISKLGLKSAEFCAKLLEQEKVAAVPGIAFGADDYLRISYATSMANIEKGLDRLEKFAGNLAKEFLQNQKGRRPAGLFYCTRSAIAGRIHRSREYHAIEEIGSSRVRVREPNLTVDAD